MANIAKEKKEKFLYLHLKDKILEDYADKPYFTPLKSERELCDKYQVSRPTIRKALALLEQLKVIKRIPGKGAIYMGNEDFVETFPREQASEISFYNNVRMHGDYTSSKVLLQNIEQASPDIAVRLNIKEKSLIFHLERLRYINGRLYSLSSAYIPYHLCPELLQKDFTDISLHNTMEEYGIYLHRAQKIIEISRASEYDALHLNLTVGDPVAVTQTISVDVNDNIVEYAITKAPAHKMRIEMTVFNSKWSHMKAEKGQNK